MTKSKTNIFETEAPKYWDKDLTVIPVPHGTKRGIEKWSHFIDQVPSDLRKKEWLQKHGGHGIALLTGKTVFNGMKLIGIDVDDDLYTEAIKRIFAPVVSAKKGKKGITIFVLADLDVKHTAINFDQERIIDVLIRKCCVIPPTIHPDTGKPYEWIGTPLYDCDFNDLVIVTKQEIDLLKALIENPEHRALLSGKATHDPAVSLTASLARRFDGNLIIKYLNALLPEDYNGNLRKELLEMVLSAKEKGFGVGSTLEYKPNKTGPLPMGYTDNGNYVFLHQGKNILSVLPPKNLMSVAGLCDLAPYDFWHGVCPLFDKDGLPTSKIDHTKIGDLMMNLCRRTGPFTPSRVRGCGVWREGDKNIQNLRGNLPQSNQYTYIRFEPLPDFKTDRVIDPQKILDWYNLFNWSDKGYPMLLLGWTVLAPICGALGWRTHIFIHGAKKTGKSTLIRGLTTLLEPMAISLDGTSSEAGIRQSIAADSRPVILDEFESDGNVARMRNILKLARSASTGAAPIARGTPEGKALQFQVHSSFCFGAIIPIVGTAADRSRIVELELNSHDDSSVVRNLIEAGQSYLDEHRLSWAHQIISLIEPINESLKVFRQVMPAGDLRHNQNMENLLGAAFTVLHGRSATSEEAEKWVQTHQSMINKLSVAHEEDDSSDCINHLLEYRARDDLTIGEMLNYSDASECIPIVTDGPLPNLQKYGIKPYANGFLVANKHRELNQIYNGTIWANGGWQSTLKRLPGAQVGNEYRTRFSGGNIVRCVFIPLALFED